MALSAKHDHQGDPRDDDGGDDPERPPPRQRRDGSQDLIGNSRIGDGAQTQALPCRSPVDRGNGKLALGIGTTRLQFGDEPGGQELRARRRLRARCRWWNSRDRHRIKNPARRGRKLCCSSLPLFIIWDPKILLGASFCVRRPERREAQRSPRYGWHVCPRRRR